MDKNSNSRRKTRRTSSQREEHLENYDFEGPEYVTNSLPFFRPSHSETPPAVHALWLSIAGFLLASGWFAISLVGYLLIWKLKQPLPAGETMNIERIFDAVPLNRWAVNVVTSLFVCTVLLCQTLFLIAYRIDRRQRRDLAWGIMRSVVSSSNEGDQDHWDQKASNDGRHTTRDRAAPDRKFDQRKYTAPKSAIKEAAASTGGRPSTTGVAGGYGGAGRYEAQITSMSRGLANERSTGKDMSPQNSMEYTSPAPSYRTIPKHKAPTDRPSGIGRADANTNIPNKYHSDTIAGQYQGLSTNRPSEPKVNLRAKYHQTAEHESPLDEIPPTPPSTLYPIPRPDPAREDLQGAATNNKPPRHTFAKAPALSRPDPPNNARNPPPAKQTQMRTPNKRVAVAKQNQAHQSKYDDEIAHKTNSNRKPLPQAASTYPGPLPRGISRSPVSSLDSSSPSSLGSPPSPLDTPPLPIPPLPPVPTPPSAVPKTGSTNYDDERSGHMSRLDTRSPGAVSSTSSDGQGEKSIVPGEKDITSPLTGPASVMDRLRRIESPTSKSERSRIREDGFRG